MGAGIPTVWRVMLGLISKVARVLGEHPGDDVSKSGIRNASGRNVGGEEDGIQ